MELNWNPIQLVEFDSKSDVVTLRRQNSSFKQSPVRLIEKQKSGLPAELIFKKKINNLSGFNLWENELATEHRSALLIDDQMSDLKSRQKQGRIKKKLKLNLDLSELMTSVPAQGTVTSRETEITVQATKRKSTVRI